MTNTDMVLTLNPGTSVSSWQRNVGLAPVHKGSRKHQSFRINLKTKEIQKQILFNQFKKDDHDNPAFLELADNGYIAFMPNMGVEIFIIIEIQKKRINYLERLPFLIPLVKRGLKNFPKKAGHLCQSCTIIK